MFSFSRAVGAVAKRFFKRILKAHQGEPRRIVTDQLRSCGVAHRELMPDVIHDTSQYAIIVLNFRINQPEYERGGCVVSNHRDRRNDFLVFMQQFTIYSI